MQINGIEVETDTGGTASAPSAIYAGTADFALFARGDANNKLLGRIRELGVAEGFYTSPPSDPNAIKARYMGPGLIDLSGNANHLVQSGGIDEESFANDGGQNPVLYAVELNGTDEALGVAKSALANNLTSGFVVEVDFEYIGDGTTVDALVSLNSATHKQFLLRINNGLLQQYLSSDGSTWAQYIAATSPLAANTRHTAKFLYDGSGTKSRIYFNGSLVASSDSAPASLFDATDPDFMLGVTGSISSPITQWANIKLHSVSVSATPSGQDNGDPITDVIHRWRPSPDAHYEEGGNDKIADDFGGAHLTMVACDRSNVVYYAGGDLYVVADRLAQSVKAVDRVFYTRGEREIDLVGGTDYVWDSEDLELTVIHPDVGQVYIDARGAVCGDIPAGVSGRADSDLAGLASDAILFILSAALGVDDDLIDSASFAAARVGDKAIGLYLSSRTSISQLLHRLCLSGCLLDLIVDDKFRLRRWAPDLDDTVSVAGQEIDPFRQPLRTDRLYSRVRVVYNGGSVEAEVAEAVELHGATAVKEITTYLAGASDARLLAARLALLAARPPLSADGTIANLRLADRRPGDALLISRDNAAGPDGSLISYPFRIARIRQLAGSGASAIETDDWLGAGPWTAKVVAAGTADYAGSDAVARAKGGFVKTSTAAQKEGQLCF